MSEDVFKVDADYLRESERNGTPRAVLRGLFPEKYWPSEWPRPEEEAEIERKKRLAQQALDAGKGTVELPPDPAPPGYDDSMPF